MLSHLLDMSADKNHRAEEEQPLKNDIQEKDENFQNKTFLEKLRYVKSNITVEPVLAGYIIPSMLASIAIQNLNLDKACRVKLNYSDEICDAFIRREGNLTYYEGEVQKVISSIEAWKSLVHTALPTVLVIFMGAWSDRTGNRKLSILLPICGEFLVCVSNILSTYFFYEIPIEVTMFFEALFPALTGGWVMICLGVFSYTSDITDEKSRTFRIGLVNLCMTAGVPIGTALSGILLKLWGYYGIFFLAGSIYLVTFVYGYVTLKTKTKPGTDNNEKSEPLRCLDLITLVKETVQVAFKKRDFNLRKKIIITLAIVGIVYGPDHAERIILYMFLRYRLKWDALKFSIYSTYNIIAHSLGALFSITLFSKYLGFHDSILCLISVGSKFISSIYLTTVKTDLGMFMLPIVQILNATTFTSLRSLASKLVVSEEMGKMNSLFSLVETLSALVFDPTYSAMYAKTVSTFTGAVFVFTACVLVPAIIMLLWIFIQHRREIKVSNQDAAKEEITFETIRTSE